MVSNSVPEMHTPETSQKQCKSLLELLSVQIDHAELLFLCRHIDLLTPLAILLRN